MKRLTPATLTLIMLMLVGGLIVAYVARKMFAREEVVVQEEIVNVPMAIADLEPGTLLTEGHLASGPAYRSKLDREVVRSDKVLVGRVVKTKILAAQPIRTTELYPPGQRPPLAVVEGMRAVSISVATTTDLVDGLVQPGEFVDVHFSPASAPNDSATGGMTMTLFKGVKVLAVNRSTVSAAAGRGGNSVTLELTKDQANIIILAKEKGSLTLTITPDGKGTGGVALSNEDLATLREILNLDPPTKPEPPQVTELYSGVGRRIMSFKDGMRSDQYELLRYDWNQSSQNQTFGGGYRAMPNAYGGYWSVPSGNGPAPGGDSGGAGGAGGSGGAAGGNPGFNSGANSFRPQGGGGTSNESGPSGFSTSAPRSI